MENLKLEMDYLEIERAGEICELCRTPFREKAVSRRKPACRKE